MEKKIMIVGDLGVGGERGRIVFGGVLQHPLPLLNTKTHRKLLRHMEIIILGAIGNTPRQNRDNMRVLDRGGKSTHLNPT